MPLIIVLAGPNGAGKSTAAAHLLPESIPFVNADDIAKKLPNYPSPQADIAAGRIVLARLDELGAARSDFAFETTLASLSLAARVTALRKSGYVLRLIFLWTPHPEFSIRRVAARVKAGGHHIPEETIRRRHKAGIINFFGRYQAIADKWEVYDNTRPHPSLIAEGTMQTTRAIFDPMIWARMRSEVGDA